jgi:hypothetical protein
MNTTKFAVKATIAGLALAASVIAVAPAAQAQRLGGPGATSLDAQCFQIGNDYVDGVAAFKSASAAGDQAAMDAAGKKLRTAEDQWKAICEGVYGSLYIAADVSHGETSLGGTSPHPPVPAGTAVPRAGQDAQRGVQ